MLGLLPTRKNVLFIATAILLLSPMAQSQESNGPKLSLSEAINQSLSNNLGLKIQQIAPQIEEENIIKRKAAFDTDIFADGQVGQSDLKWIDANDDSRRSTSDTRSYAAGLRKRISTGALLSTSTRLDRSQGTSYSTELGQLVGGPLSERASFNISISQPLLQNYGAKVNNAPIRRAEARAREAEFRLKNQTSDLLLNTEISYWRLADSYERRALRESNIKLAQDQLNESLERQRIGMATKLEVLQAEANLARRKQEIIQADQAIANAADELLSATGSLDENLAIDTRPSIQRLEIPDHEQPDYDTVLNTSFEKNFNTPIQEEILNQLEQDLILARNDKRPEVDLNLSTSYNGLSPNDANDAFGRALDWDGNDWGIRLGFNLPWGRRASKANLRQAEHNIDRANLQLAEIKQDLVKTVRSAWRDLHTAREQLNASEVVVELQQATFEQEQGKYNEGLSSLRDVLETQRDLDNAVLNYLDAQLSAAESEIRLERAQGTLLERHNLNWNSLPGSLDDL